MSTTFMIVVFILVVVAVGGIVLLGGRGDAKRKLKEKIDAQKKK